MAARIDELAEFKEFPEALQRIGGQIKNLRGHLNEVVDYCKWMGKMENVPKELHELALNEVAKMLETAFSKSKEMVGEFRLTGDSKQQGRKVRP